jgi:hypothetical protein
MLKIKAKYLCKGIMMQSIHPNAQSGEFMLIKDAALVFGKSRGEYKASFKCRYGWSNIDANEYVECFNNTINIFVDETNIETLAYNQAKEAVRQGVQVINTTCLNFFCFDYFFMHNYDVIIHNKDGGKISLMELLDSPLKFGVRKELRRAHNAYKMFISGAVGFKSPPIQ